MKELRDQRHPPIAFHTVNPPLKMQNKLNKDSLIKIFTCFIDIGLHSDSESTHFNHLPQSTPEHACS